MFLIIFLQNLFINYLSNNILIILIYILKLIYSFFLFLIYLTILYFITLSRFDIYILTNIVVSLIYSKNTFICFLFISFIFSIFNKKRFKVYIKIVFAILYIQIINKYFYKNNKLVVNKQFNCYIILQIYICLCNF